MLRKKQLTFLDKNECCHVFVRHFYIALSYAKSILLDLKKWTNGTTNHQAKMSAPPSGIELGTICLWVGSKSVEITGRYGFGTIIMTCYLIFLSGKVIFPNRSFQ